MLSLFLSLSLSVLLAEKSIHPPILYELIHPSVRPSAHTKGAPFNYLFRTHLLGGGGGVGILLGINAELWVLGLG